MLFKMRSAYFVAALSAALTVAAVASAKYAVSGKPSIVATAKAPFGTFTANSSSLRIEEDDKNIIFISHLNSFATGNEGRDKHMKERIGKVQKIGPNGKPEVNDKNEPVMEDHFEIRLTVAKDKVDPKKSGTVPGVLKFHRVSKPVTVNYTVEGDKITAKFDLNVVEHGVPDTNLCFIPKPKSICADPKVAVAVTFNFKNS